MKKLTALCAIMVFVFASCTTAPVTTDMTRIDTNNAVFKAADTVTTNVDTISSDTVNHK